MSAALLSFSAASSRKRYVWPFLPKLCTSIHEILPTCEHIYIFHQWLYLLIKICHLLFFQNHLRDVAWFCLPHLSTYTFCKPPLLIFLQKHFPFCSKVHRCGWYPLCPSSLWILKVSMRGLALRSKPRSSTVMCAGFLFVSLNNLKRWTKTLMSCRLCSHMCPIWWQCGVTCISCRDTYMHRQRLHLPISRSSILVNFSK